MNEMARRIREGDLRALARAATGVENRDPEALAALGELAPLAGHARIVGITGPPGAGKSTLVDALALALRERGRTVAVLAVDPSSRMTGGAILGDRIRMSRHHADAGIFIRSMATRGSVGGLAAATRDLALLMDAAGRDYVLIETVGVGQDEIEIAGLAGTTVVVLVPGMGDDVQALKAGILEIADVFAINKADQPGADRVEHDLRAALGLVEGPQPPIVRTVATEGKGVAELLDVLERLPGRAWGRLEEAAVAAHRQAGADQQTGVSDTEPADVAQALLPAVSRLISTRVGGGDAVLNAGVGMSGERSLTEKSPAAETGASGDNSPAENRLGPEGTPGLAAPQSGTRVETNLDTAGKSACATFAFYAAPGLRPTPVGVPDLGAAAEQLSAAGGRLLNQPPEDAESHLYVFAEPVLLELIQESAS